MSYHIITPVGTSLLRSYGGYNEEFSIESLRGLLSDDEVVKQYFSKYSKDIIQFISSKEEDQSSCAETGSIESFMNQYEQNELDGITMLPTDTAESYLAYMFISEYMKSKGYKIHCRVIKKLSYSDPKTFESKGLKNLLEEIKRSIIQIRKEKAIPIINATPGFKAESAMILLMGQFLKVDVFYVHELMKNHTVIFPNLPVEIEKSFWNDWKPVIQATLDADSSDSGVLDICEFNEMKKYLDMNKAEFLFEINEEFGGVSLSVLGFLIAEAFDLELEKIELKKSDVEEEKRLDLNESEMHHATKGSRHFMNKIAELNFVKKIKNIKLENSAESRIKVKYDDRDPGEIQVTHSDGEKGLGIVVKTTARDQAENIQAKALIARHVNISIGEGEDEDEGKHLFQSGQLLKRSINDEIVSISELISKAEDIIIQGEKITKPYEEKIEKERSARRKFENKSNEMGKKVNQLKEEVKRLQAEANKDKNPAELNLDKLVNKHNKDII